MEGYTAEARTGLPVRIRVSTCLLPTSPFRQPFGSQPILEECHIATVSPGLEYDESILSCRTLGSRIRLKRPDSRKHPKYLSGYEEEPELQQRATKSSSNGRPDKRNSRNHMVSLTLPPLLPSLAFARCSMECMLIEIGKPRWCHVDFVLTPSRACVCTYASDKLARRGAKRVSCESRGAARSRPTITPRD